MPNPGYHFVNWTEGGVEVGATTNYDFTLTADRMLIANYALIPVSVTATNSASGSLVFSWSSAAPGWVLQESTDLNPGSWTNSTKTVTVNGNDSSVTILPMTGNKFFRLAHP